MDRLNQLRGKAGGSCDSTLDTTSPSSDAYITVNDSSNYFSLSDSTFDTSPIKDVTLASSSAEQEDTVKGAVELVSDLSSISNNEKRDSYKIGNQIEAANILSGGVDIFEDNDNSFDGHELVIDDNNDEMDNKSSDDKAEAGPDTCHSAELKPSLVEAEVSISSTDPVSAVINDIDVLSREMVESENQVAREESVTSRNIEKSEPAVVKNCNEASTEKDELEELIVEGEVTIHNGKFVEPVPCVVEDVKIINNETDEPVPPIVQEVDREIKEPEPVIVDEEINEMEEPDEPGEVNIDNRDVDELEPPNAEEDEIAPHREIEEQEAPVGEEEINLVRREMEVLLQINGIHVNAIDIGNGLYLYRRDEGEELSAIQIIGDVPHCTIKFLKVRDNAHGNLEVYEEIEIEVPKEVPVAEKKPVDKNMPVPTNSNKVMSDSTSNNNGKRSSEIEPVASTSKSYQTMKDGETSSQCKSEVNKNGNMLKLSEPRQSQVVESLIPIPFHSTPIKEGKPLTKTMVDLQLHPNRHSDNVKKTIEVHTDNMNPKQTDQLPKERVLSFDNNKAVDNISTEKRILGNNQNTAGIKNVTICEKKVVDMITSTKGKSGGNSKPKRASSNLSTSSPPVIPLEAKIDASMLEKDICSLVTGPNMTSTSPTINAQKSELNTMNPIESATSGLVSSTENIKENNVNEDMIDPKAIVMTMSNTEEKKLLLSLDIEHRADSSSKLPDETKCLSMLPELINDADINNTQEKPIEQPKLVPEVHVPSKTDESDLMSLQKPTLPEAKSCTVPSEPLHISSEKDADPRASEVKSGYKNTFSRSVSDTKLPEEASFFSGSDIKQGENLISITESNVKILGNTVHSAAVSNVRPSDKSEHNLCVSELKPAFKEVQSIAVLKGKPSEKATSFSALPVVKVPECSLYNINKSSKHAAHIPIVANIASKPNSRHIPIKILKSEDSKKLNIKELMTKNNVASKNLTQIKTDKRDGKDPINELIPDRRPVNNNHAVAVPFGKWTDVNRQEFLNKFKEVKAPVHPNTKSIKNSNDLNRRDVLKKIDSQRAQTIINNATAKAQEKLNVKSEAVFSSKIKPPKVETKMPLNSETINPKLPSNKAPIKEGNAQKSAVPSKNAIKQDNPHKAITSTVLTGPFSVETCATDGKIEPALRKGLSTATVANLIDKTIEGMINRAVPGKNASEESKEIKRVDGPELTTAAEIPNVQQIKKATLVDTSGTLDDIEMKMNELHGIPFVERPPHELPKVLKPEIKTYSKVEKDTSMDKVSKIPLITSSEPEVVKHNIVGIDSEEEVIEHEPITGDMIMKKKNISNKLPVQEQKTHTEKSTGTTRSKDECNNEAVITETDFDKFARRNSKTYENCLTVNFEHKEQPNVVQIVKERELDTKNSFVPKNKTICIDAKSKKHTLQDTTHAVKARSNAKFGSVNEDTSSKNYQSKIHTAYNSLTAKHQTSAITMIEDKPVKVVYVESNTGFVASQLNVQGQELATSKKLVTAMDIGATTNTDSVDSDMFEVIDENKHHDKTKSKHQRKQVLTPVEEPELELIQPSDIGMNVTPKKKRKTDDSKADKNTKNVIHKKSYLLGRNNLIGDKVSKPQILKDDPQMEALNRTVNPIEHKDAASAIDSLVKAAELLENQIEITNNKNFTESPESPTNTPVKRGRGRPRKYPLPEGAIDSKTPSPQKKPRLIDAKPPNEESISDDQYDTSDDEMVRENWTMGKINENIVCPICNKLFRSENVVFKHVKHCTGVSPNRSESDKQSPRRSRLSQEFESISDLDEIPVKELKKISPAKRKSKDSNIVENSLEINNRKEATVDVIVIEDTPIKEKTNTIITKSEVREDDVIVIEDTPVKEKVNKHDKDKNVPVAKVTHRTSNDIVCDTCGKKFRQLSYLASHKLQHKKEQSKKVLKDVRNSNKLQVFSCEVCKKKFSKLHHLVQHRIIHNPDAVPKRSLRNSSSDLSDIKNVKHEKAAKQNDDQSAGFRCEPCDKSFRKLHHLVEHRETHEGINRHKFPEVAQVNVEKPSSPPQCEICKKTFRKLHHLVEHREQHADNSSEKSDDKSVQSSLSTKDIIHECSLCYMVFPNEHSLNKHTVICLRKKRQSKQPKENIENESVMNEEMSKGTKEEKDDTLLSKTNAEKIIGDELKIEKEPDYKGVINCTNLKKVLQVEGPANTTEIKQTIDDKVTLNEITVKNQQKVIEVNSIESPTAPSKRDLPKSDESDIVETSVVPEKVKKIDHKEVKIQDTPKKKTHIKDKVTTTVAKRQKSNDASPAAMGKVTIAVESSDDDEVRYMLNPNFKDDIRNKGKIFMKVRANKRNSLQFDCEPKSKELVKMRTSVQPLPKILHPEALENKEKVADPKPKALESKAKSGVSKSQSGSAANHIPTGTSKHIRESMSQNEALSTDSDDSDIKYSFPESASEIPKQAPAQTLKKNAVKIPKKSLLQMRKSIGSIAKRKSLQKSIMTKHKAKDLPSKPIKKRTRDVEHRCDCGQLFSSAALLSRHTSLAHTPPRIRRRRDVSPPAQPPAKPSRAKSLSATQTTQPATASKSSLKSDASGSKPSPSVRTRKSSVRSETTPGPAVTRKSIVTNSKGKVTKTGRPLAHSGVPVPEKMRKMLEKIKKRPLD